MGTMLNQMQVLELLENATNEYIKALEINSFSFAEHKAEIMAYIKVLNIEGLQYKYMDKDKAQELLKVIKDM